MIVEHDADCGEVYGRVRRDLIATARALSDEQLNTRVPATPAWTVHDVLAHVVGIAADLNARRFPAGSDDQDRWTDRQIATRRTAGVVDLDAEWEQQAGAFEEGLRVFGHEVGSHFVADLVQHCQDVRSALALPRVADEQAIAVGLDFYLDRFHQDLSASAHVSVTIVVGGEQWTLGTGPVVATVEAEPFELLRCLGGRRSEAQVRALHWSGDPDLVIGHVSAYPMPPTDLVDP